MKKENSDVNEKYIFIITLKKKKIKEKERDLDIQQDIQDVLELTMVNLEGKKIET